MTLSKPALSVVLTIVAACGGGGSRSQLPAIPAAVPVAPAHNDDGFVYGGLKRYYLIGNALTPDESRLTLTIKPADANNIRASAVYGWIDRRAGVRLTEGPDHEFTLRSDVSSLGPGEHEILLARDGNATAFGRFTFYRTHPLYVVVSSDWDEADNADVSLRLQEALHKKHPDLVLTHLVGPYTFTDPKVTEGRRAMLARWVIDMRATYHDEIGVHIHPWCHFVDFARVPCRTMPSTIDRAGDTTGSSIVVASYSERELVSILNAARRLFAERGLGNPTAFRAGGWTAGINTLRALAATGFTIADGLYPALQQ